MAALPAAAVGQGESFELDAVVRRSPSWSQQSRAAVSTKNSSVAGFLEGAGLGHHAANFKEFGFTDLGMLADKVLGLLPFYCVSILVYLLRLHSSLFLLLLLFSFFLLTC